MADQIRQVKNIAIAVAAEQPYKGPDPNERQRKAAYPDRSVWVNASAGSGKTKVLTDRVLRLLLPPAAGQNGTPPHRLLCLTFTKAGANEMALRLNERLSQWAVMEEQELVADMRDKLLGRQPHDFELQAARNLFARIVDLPGGLKIMTIHAFCQSLLGRFPLEAGLPPHFTALDEGQAQRLVVAARDSVLATARANPESEPGKALKAIAAIQHDSGFVNLLRDVISERHQLRGLLASCGGAPGVYSEICRHYGIPPGMEAGDIICRACENTTFNERGLREACRVLTEIGTEKKDGGKALGIQLWLDADNDGRLNGFHEYKRNFFKSDGGILKDQCTKAVRDARPDIDRVLQDEAERLYNLADQINAASSAALTRDLLLICSEILNIYEELKRKRAALDFDDLILHTLALLRDRDMAGWVMYKLDEGLDHILIDEAQDTNPEQWEIIKALCDEFFSGAGARDDVNRTIFSVRDDKQSIYSFQRAAPEKFQAMQAYFADKVKAAQLGFEQVALNVSFRSVGAVLSFVDRVFATEEMRKGLGSAPVTHTSFHHTRPGLVELWPLFVTPDKQPRDFWSPPAEPLTSRSGAAMLAEHIGDTIKHWLDTGEILAAKGRPIRAGDVMILVRSRTAFVNQMIRALKTRQVPVSGVDRMVLKDQLAVQDLLACAQFALLPDDDLSLACILKSPLIGWTDPELESVAAYRPAGQSLWEALRDRAGDNSSLACLSGYLKRLIDRAGAEHPYEYFSRLLQEECPASPLGGMHAMTARLGEEVIDPLDEFLNAALEYEANDLPTIQGYLTAIQRGDADIKRAQEEGGNAVRILTVHGAKGLQAPIVIMPDTVRTVSTPPGHGNHRLIWPNKSGLPVPLWSPRKDMDCRTYSGVLNTINQRQDEEYRRLLYVAMTRAEDRIYIAGHTGKKPPLAESWYNYMKAAMEALPDHESLPFSAKAFDDSAEKPILLRYGDEKPVQGSKAEETHAVRPDRALLEDHPWVLRHPPQESGALRPYAPSRSHEEELPVFSPLSGADNYRFRRGLVTHKLLQFLPDMAEDSRENAAMRFVSRYAADLPEDVQQDIVRETMLVLRHEEWAPLFGPGSQAEVPLTGRSGDRMISGQVDRLYVSDEEVWIVDYKSNRPAPRDPAAIPEVYRQQMVAYRDIVATIYAGRSVRCFLLWTDGPQLMPVAVEEGQSSA